MRISCSTISTWTDPNDYPVMTPYMIESEAENGPELNCDLICANENSGTFARALLRMQLRSAKPPAHCRVALVAT